MKFDRGFFIIGTDTDIGKTYVSSLLYKGIKEGEGSYYKPVQSGCIRRNGELYAPDVEFVCSMSEKEYDKNMVTYTLEAEVSPHLASELEGIKIDIERIREAWIELKEKYRYMLVEGAGGLYVPLIRDKFYIFDLIKELDLPVILVCGSKVGAINHTILTIEALKKMGISIHGLVFNRVSEDLESNYFEKDNIDVILKLSGIEKSLLVNSGQREIPKEELQRFLEIEV